jgi:Na+/H+-dicarboxylate symporter
MIRIALHWQIFIALVAGVAAGFLLGEKVLYIEFFGTLFLKALKMIIVPLIATSIISGIASIGSAGHVGRFGVRTFAYYISTSLLAILTGLVLVNLIQPGTGADLGLQKKPEELQESLERFGDSPLAALQRLLLDMVPANPFQAMAEGEVLQLIVFSLLFGFFMTRLAPAYSESLMNFFQAAFEAMMQLTHFVIRFAPLGIFALVAQIVATTGLAPFADLALYAATVILGLLIHALLTLPLILALVARVPPWRHVRAMSPALLTAFSTSSSSATLPLTLEALEKRAGISNRTASFVAPLGATVNMDGTALYECVAAMFIAQAYGVELHFGQQVLVVVTSLLASIGAAGIPMAGLVMISVILTAVGLPLEGLGLILAVDRILDMCRTTVNVWSDACGAAVVAKRAGEEF